VTRADVEAAAGAAPGGALEPLRGVRRAMAVNMTEAHAKVVPATLTEVADIHEWPAQTVIIARLVRAVCAACAREPALNAAFLGIEQGRRHSARVDLGIAMDTPDGLFVPVLRDAGRRSAEDLMAGLARMKADVRARTVPRDELRGATITLSNFGMLGGQHASLVVLPPQVAIVGAGRVQERVLAHRGQVAIRRTVPLSLSFDHRAVTGGEAARFMAAMVEDLGRAR
jgi:pyruvate dehydrogenase E2 component (dihydrolipoamide acetyltransferase)